MSDGRSTGPEGPSRRLRVAEVFDGRGPTGGILVDRPQVNPAEMAALTAYLTKAPVALATTKTGEDEMSPGAGLVVPRAYHTDGEWIWPAAVGYYLHRYHLPPQTELVDHIRARGFQMPSVAEELRQAAAAQMLEVLAAAKRGAAAPVASGAPGASAPGDSGAPSGSQASATSGAPVVSQTPAASAVPSSAPVMPLVSAPTPDLPAIVPEVQPAEPGLWTPEPVGAPSPVGTPSPASGSIADPAASIAESAATPVPVAESEPEGFAKGESFSPAFTAAGNRHAAWVYEQIETFLDYMPVADWSVDHETGRYRQAGREFTVDALGRLDQSGHWVWAWAEAEAWSANPALTERARRLRDQGDRLGIKELMEPVLDLAEIADADDPETAAEMLAWTAMGVAGARGYLGHTFTDENRVYYLAFDETIPTAKPDLDAVVHYLTEGADKFEEDPSDCVLGYVEHHGWDWSRSAEGIVVSAGALGTFTATLAADGALNSVRPNR